MFIPKRPVSPACVAAVLAALVALVAALVVIWVALVAALRSVRPFSVMFRFPRSCWFWKNFDICSGSRRAITAS